VSEYQKLKRVSKTSMALNALVDSFLPQSKTCGTERVNCKHLRVIQRVNAYLNVSAETKLATQSCDSKCQIAPAAAEGGGDCWSVAMADQDVLPIFVVDAFTSVPFSGNPAAVCLITTTHVSKLLLFDYI